MGVSPRPADVIGRLHRAMNDHDLEALLDCFHKDYESVQPVHPSRNFRGKDQVEKNWSAVFKNLPDFRAELIRMVVDGDTIWTEWDWAGTQPDGNRMNMRGVVLFGVRDGKIAWGRLYMDVAEQTEEDIDTWVEQATEGKARA
jgi:ketosteroid isomerase-like protein